MTEKKTTLINTGALLVCMMLFIIPLLFSSHTVQYMLFFCVLAVNGAIVWFSVKKLRAGYAQQYRIEEKEILLRIEHMIASMTTFLKKSTILVPVLTGQLGEVINQTETAALEIGSHFMDIVERAESQAKKAKEAVECFTAQDGANTGALELGKRTIHDAMQNMQKVMDEIKGSVDNIQVIVHDMADIQDLVKEVAYIADQTRLLSFNAAIEAARAGENGKGFAVVAGEVGKLSERSNTTARTIRTKMQKIESDIGRVYSETTESVSRSSDLARDVQEKSSKTMEEINGAISTVNISLTDLTHEAAQLASDIGSIIMNMQFQDITRQRIEHVVEPLLKLKEDTETALEKFIKFDEALSESQKGVDAQWLEKLYTMESERDVLRSMLKADSSAEQ